MNYKFLKKELVYDGTQLAPHWIYKKTQILGDAIVSFIGPANVPLENMVDLEDVVNQAPIYSPLMLHFLIEHFNCDLKNIVFCQRIFCAIVLEELLKKIGSTKIIRRGDDLFEQDKKLSVSIATISPVSGLIHLGINIETKGTPVPTKGLKDYQIDPKEFAELVMKRYVEEMLMVETAKCKVRPV
ncbi:MAG: DUF366 family protein [Pseudomonadota bacterium]